MQQTLQEALERAGGVKGVDEQLLPPRPNVHRAERHEVRVGDRADPAREGGRLLRSHGTRGAHEPEQHGGLPGAHHGAVQRAVRGLGDHLPGRLKDGGHRQRLPAGELDERPRPGAALRAQAEPLGDGAQVRQRAEAVGDGHEVGQHVAGRAPPEAGRQAVHEAAKRREARPEEPVQQVGEEDADDGEQDGVAPPLVHLLPRRRRLCGPRHLHGLRRVLGIKTKEPGVVAGLSGSWRSPAGKLVALPCSARLLTSGFSPRPGGRDRKGGGLAS
jgi:hypothetical protein